VKGFEIFEEQFGALVDALRGDLQGRGVRPEQA
jgi:hypothetical protein